MSCERALLSWLLHAPGRRCQGQTQPASRRENPDSLPCGFDTTSAARTRSGSRARPIASRACTWAGRQQPGPVPLHHHRATAGRPKMNRTKVTGGAIVITGAQVVKTGSLGRKSEKL